MSASLGGAASGSVTFQPSPLPAGGTSSATTAPPGSTTGVVSLEVTVHYSGLELTVTDTASVELDGTRTATTT